MNKYVIDTNILFSAILNVDSKIGQLIINGNRFFEFYAPYYIRYEIFSNRNKLKKIAKLNENNFIELYELLVSRFTIIHHSLIPFQYLESARDLCKSIDPDDIIFVALSQYLKATIWTGDLKLINGLKAKGYNQIITTNDLYDEFTACIRKKGQ